jgi:hypothetical protein
MADLCALTVREAQCTAVFEPLKQCQQLNIFTMSVFSNLLLSAAGVSIEQRTARQLTRTAEVFSKRSVDAVPEIRTSPN